jgi:hypothetical protein
MQVARNLMETFAYLDEGAAAPKFCANPEVLDR